MSKDYSIQGTTKLQREKFVNDAIALSTLDTPEPSDYALSLIQEYIDGKSELSEVRKRIVSYHKRVQHA
jgi:hypothetical protein